MVMPPPPPPPSGPTAPTTPCLPTSGPISLADIHEQFSGDTAPTLAGLLELGEYYGQDNAPTSGAISFSDFYGKCGIPTSGLQFHWDGQISESNTGTGGVEDIGTFDRDGTLTNGASYNSGNFGKLVFDGVDDYVNLSGYNGVTGTTARTSIVFFKLDSNTITSQQRLFTWGDPATNGGKWAMELNTSNNFSMGVSGGAQQSTKTLTVNGWNMLSATWPGSAGGGGTPDAIFDFILVGTVVTGTGVPNNTTVTAFNSSSGTITLSNNLTTTISGATLTFTNNHLTAGGGNGGGGGGASGGSGGSSSGISRTNGGSGGSGGSGASDGGGGAGAGGYTGNGGGENQNGSGGGGAGGANDGDGGGGVGIYGSGSSGTAPRGGGSGGASGQNTSGTGGDGGNYGGGGGGVRGNNGSGSGGDGGDGVVRFVWGSYSYPSNAANGISNQQTFTSSGTFTVPSGVTSVSAVVVGGGGGGGDNDPDKDDEGGGGGGGGALAYGSWTASAGQQYTVTVGSGGNGGSGDGDNGSSGGFSRISIADTNTEGASGTTGTNTITIGTGAPNDLEDITLYHNAQKLVNYNTGTQTIDTTTSTNVAIGRANAGTAGNIDGEIAKALIYNRALTHSEIAQIYNAKCVALGLSQAGLSTESGSVTVTSATSVSEGSSISFTVANSGFTAGETLYYTLDGVSGTVNSSDFTAGTTSGSFSMTPGTNNVISIGIAADGSTEGTETFKMNVRTTSTSGTIIGSSSVVTINDVTTPTYSISQSASTIYETSSAGTPQSVVFTITTTNVANGTTLYWTLGGGEVSSADFTQATTSGSFTINNNTGSVTLTARNDGTSDDKEDFTLQVRTGSTSGTIVATSATVRIEE